MSPGVRSHRQKKGCPCPEENVSTQGGGGSDRSGRGPWHTRMAPAVQLSGIRKEHLKHKESRCQGPEASACGGDKQVEWSEEVPAGPSTHPGPKCSCCFSNGAGGVGALNTGGARLRVKVTLATMWRSANEGPKKQLVERPSRSGGAETG